MESLFFIYLYQGKETVYTKFGCRAVLVIVFPGVNQVFRMSKNEGSTNVEIPEYLDISIKMAESHLAKPLKILNGNLKECDSRLVYDLLPS